jgi:hypothetical protein
MALWGNNDAKGSGGTVSLNYGTLTVTGTGTTFGQVGAAATGDVIRFGNRTGTYYGDAVIVGITSATVLSIASTAGLSGAAISGVAFKISESPKYVILDSNYQAFGTDIETIAVLKTAATYTAGVATSVLLVDSVTGLLAGDTILNNGTSKVVASIGATSVSFASTIGVAISAGAAVTFFRATGGKKSFVYGVAEDGTEAAQTTTYALTHEGWVGVTTYTDSEGNLRVKKETLVAMSGITTGNAPTYPPF